MSVPRDWYRDEHALLASVKSSTGLGRRAPSIPGYDGLRELGRGGQGMVYAATQRSTKRTVAIKVLLEGAFASETTRRRFEREVDLVASLRHPNIVQVYDSGVTEEGYPFYVMEYIEGVSLDELVRPAALGLEAGRGVPPDVLDAQAAPGVPVAFPSIQATLQLWAKVCEAVNYAHQRGVIHRDLKPSNIRIDPAGEPHVLDFGLAKSVAAGLGPGERTALMSVSGQFTGSLPWASPEQTEGEPSRIDVRTDVYSLGVLGYQLLTGRFPYPVAGPFQQVIRSIQQAAPARPSTLRPEIDDEVETIVLKALAKERERRYQSAGELARDIRHYLNREPIEAKRDSAWYNLRKTLRRYRLAAGVAGSFFVLAVVVAISTSLLYRRAVRAERAAERRRLQAVSETDKARRTQQFLQGMFGSLDPTRSRGRDAGLLRAILDDAAVRVSAELGGQPEVEAAVRATIGRTYASLGDYAVAQTHLEKALRLYRGFAPSDNLDLLGVVGDLAHVYREQDRFAEAQPLYREALDGFRRVLGEHHQDTLSAQANLGLLLDSLGEPERAEELYRQVLEVRRRVLGEQHLDTLSSKGNLGQLLLDAGRLDEAAPLVREALEGRRHLLGSDHPDTLTSINNAARLSEEQGRLDEAETLYSEAAEGYRRVLGEDHPRTIMAMNNLGVLYKQRGRLADSEALLRQALELQRRRVPDDDPAAATLLNNLARTLQESGRPAEAEPLFRLVLSTLTAVHGEEHPQTLTVLNNLAGVLADLGRRDEATALFQRCTEIRHRTLGPQHPATLLAGINWASSLRAGGDLAAAISLYDELSQSAEALPDRHWIIPYLKGGRGETLCLLKRFEEAESPLLESYDAFKETLGVDHPSTQKAAARLHELYTAWERPEKAAAYAPHQPE